MKRQLGRCRGVGQGWAWVRHHGGGEGCRRAGSVAEAVPKRRPNGYWDDVEHRRAFLEQLGRECGVGADQEWAGVSVREVEKRGGGGLLRRYSHSLQKALEATYPGRSFVPTSGRNQKQRQWDDSQVRRSFLEEVAARHDVREARDWRRVTKQQVVAMGGSGLLSHFSGSLLAALHDAFPNLRERPTECRQRLERGHWEVASNRKAFLDTVRKELGITEVQQWAAAGPHIRKKGGGRLLSAYPTLASLLRATYPDMEVPDSLELQRKAPNGFWDVAANRRAFLDMVAAKHNVRSPADWRDVSVRDVERMRGGTSVLRRHTSFHAALLELYPEQEAALQLHVCRRVAPRGHWGSAENVTKFVEDAAKQLGVGSKEEWQRVSKAQLRAVAGGGVLSTMPLVELLRKAYPDETWDAAAFSTSGKRASQRQLYLHLDRLLPPAGYQPQS